MCNDSEIKIHRGIRDSPETQGRAGVPPLSSEFENCFCFKCSSHFGRDKGGRNWNLHHLPRKYCQQAREACRVIKLHEVTREASRYGCIITRGYERSVTLRRKWYDKREPVVAAWKKQQISITTCYKWECFLEIWKMSVSAKLHWIRQFDYNWTACGPDREDEANEVNAKSKKEDLIKSILR